MAVQMVVPSAAVAWHCEIDPHASRVLARRWPNVPNLGDIKVVDWGGVQPVDLVTAGYPCQPFSLAGKRRGEDDDRHIWPDVAECVRVVRPRLVLLENVRAHLSLGFGTVLGDLAALGYDARWTCVRASDLGACHQRWRVFILASDTDGGTVGRNPAAISGAPDRTRRPGGGVPPVEHAHRNAAADPDSARRQGERPTQPTGGGSLPELVNQLTEGPDATTTDSDDGRLTEQPQRDRGENEATEVDHVDRRDVVRPGPHPRDGGGV